MVAWLIVSAVLVVAEIISLGLTTIWFAVGALAAALASFLGANVVVQLIVFAVISLILLIFTAPIARKHLIKEPEKTNVDSLIGKTGIVGSTIDNIKAEGMVILNGQEWSARSDDDQIIEKDAKVEIVSISGVKLIVKKL